MGLIGWLILGVIASAMERAIVKRDPGSFLGSLLLAWAGAALGGLVGYAVGWGAVSEVSARSLGLTTGGIILILGGVRLAQPCP